MDFILGSFVSIAAIYFANKTINNKIATNKIQVPQYSQSRAYSIIVSKFQYIMKKEDEKLETQAFKHNDKQTIRVVIHDNTAYWMQNNQFLSANVVDGMVDQETAKPVDTMSMSEVELDKISFIVEKLTEGQKNDRGNSGNTKL